MRSVSMLQFKGVKSYKMLEYKRNDCDIQYLVYFNWKLNWRYEEVLTCTLKLPQVLAAYQIFLQTFYSAIVGHLTDQDSVQNRTWWEHTSESKVKWKILNERHRFTSGTVGERNEPGYNSLGAVTLYLQGCSNKPALDGCQPPWQRQSI